MSCNKDEGIRAKGKSEEKMVAKDYDGAKRFALKAQVMNPELDGIPQLLATIDVYLSAEKKVGGESDWYEILGVSSVADENTIKKQYRKMALMLHPDKNKTRDAEGAFKLLSQAWTLLSDKHRKLAYDQRRHLVNLSKQRVPFASGSQPAAKSCAKGFYDVANNRASNMRPRESVARSSASPATTPTSPPTPTTSRSSNSHSFRTNCIQCQMQYRFAKMYLNYNVYCSRCGEPFVAVEARDSFSNDSNLSTPLFSRSGSGSTPNVGPMGFTGHVPSPTNSNWSSFAKNPAHAKSMVQKTFEKVKREREEAEAITAAEKLENISSYFVCKSKGRSSISDLKVEKTMKRRKGDHGKELRRNGSREMGMGNVQSESIKQGSFEAAKVNGVSGFSVTKFNSTRELSQLESRNMMMKKGRHEVCKKLNDLKSSNSTENKATKRKESENENGKAAVSGGMHDERKSCELIKKGTRDRKEPLDNSGISVNPADGEYGTISVPDPDFYDFDKDRSENSFEENQVWAAYDIDGMPRYYAMVQSVLSVEPFKIRISWLSSKTNTEFGPLDWIGHGFSKTCGDFKVGRYVTYFSLNSFSHKVTWTKGIRGSIQIYPKKGDIWALYRNWSPDWNQETPKSVILKYDMVEVIDDYDKEKGIYVTPLLKVVGFKAVFCRHSDPGQVKHIPREEMFRLSHQVPSYMLTGQEGENVPKGCQEIDPAATPLDLLQVINEVNDNCVEVKGEDMMV
ncbi:hypothetical protein GIB67_009371 [Kingdonia uniflora]|uniref:J domain-containing protein n=1 Tax=Kingdonia uniflora TaxID=39325 RepID=A0A7J7N383_9MAGN|nr:hypothetical protein GIB67_009371 [Kingdonia uniflora]